MFACLMYLTLTRGTKTKLEPDIKEVFSNDYAEICGNEYFAHKENGSMPLLSLSDFQHQKTNIADTYSEHFQTL